MQAYQLRNGPSALAEMHGEHLARQTRMLTVRPLLLAAPFLPPIGEQATLHALLAAYIGISRRLFVMTYWFTGDDPLPVYVGVPEIIGAVCRHFGVARADLLSARRFVSVALARHVAMYIARRLTPRSLPDIGRRIGHRDHTTVMHAIRKIEALNHDGEGGLRPDLRAVARVLGRKL